MRGLARRRSSSSCRKSFARSATCAISSWPTISVHTRRMRISAVPSRRLPRWPPSVAPSRPTAPTTSSTSPAPKALWIAAVRRAGGFGQTAVVARSNGLEHLDYQRMLDDHDHGLLHKPWSRRLLYPVVRLSQVAAAARVADRLILLNETDRDFALAPALETRRQDRRDPSRHFVGLPRRRAAARRAARPRHPVLRQLGSREGRQRTWPTHSR